MRFSEDRLARLNCADLVERTIHIWEPPQQVAPRAVILALHGGMAHGGDYVQAALYLRAHGYVTVSFDMHGHDGKRRVDIPGFDILLDDAELCLMWVKIHYAGLPVFVMGHSMGALIATHLGLGRFAGDSQITGFILSSPYYVNAIKVAPPLRWLSGLLARLVPTMKVPLASQTRWLTHDAAITERHLADERDAIRATEVTVRFGYALLQAQKELAGGLASWRFPVFAVQAGDDRLADQRAGAALLETLPTQLLDYHLYPQNYHENFNELNRDIIFGQIAGWIDARLQNRSRS